MTHANEAKKKQPAYDPIALLLAAGVHEVEQPEATILFGSRAKGTQDETESDIDIMLAISSELPDDGNWLQAQERAQQTADVLYGRRVAVQLEYVTTQDIEKHGQYLDTQAGAALAHGIFAGGNPDQFKELYDRDDPPLPKYLFENYKLANQLSLQAMHAMLTVHHKKTHPAGSRNQMMRILESMANSPGATPEELYRVVRTQAAEAMLHAVHAAQWGTGNPPGNRDNPGRKVRQAGNRPARQGLQNPAAHRPIRGPRSHTRHDPGSLRRRRQQRHKRAQRLRQGNTKTDRRAAAGNQEPAGSTGQEHKQNGSLNKETK